MPRAPGAFDLPQPAAEAVALPTRLRTPWRRKRCSDQKCRVAFYLGEVLVFRQQKQRKAVADARGASAFGG